MRVQLFTQLQAIEQQLADLARERDALLEQFAARDAMRGLRETARNMASTLRLERAHSSDLQWELDELEHRLSSLIDLERDGPSDPLIARELVLLRERRFQLEEQVLAQLEQIEQREAQLEQAEKDATAAAAAWAAREPVLQSELDTLGRRLEALQTERQALAARLPAGAIALYDDLQRRHRGTALAAIRNRQCAMCRARLPAAVFDLLNSPDPLVRCPRCGRVLYTNGQ